MAAAASKGCRLAHAFPEGCAHHNWTGQSPGVLSRERRWRYPTPRGITTAGSRVRTFQFRRITSALGDAANGLS
jgi:hypothetical protein